MENEIKIPEVGFIHRQTKPEEKSKLVYIQLDGRFVWGVSGLGVFLNTGDARKSINHKLKYHSRSYGFKDPIDMRKYLEKEGRLIYPEIEL